MESKYSRQAHDYVLCVALEQHETLLRVSGFQLDGRMDGRVEDRKTEVDVGLRNRGTVESHWATKAGTTGDH